MAARDVSPFKTKFFFAINDSGSRKRVEMEHLPEYYVKMYFQYIKNVWIFETPLSLHQFVVFSTDDYHWSVEKKDNQIVIQVFPTMQDVRDFSFDGEEREKNVSEIKFDKGIRFLTELITYIICYELENQYNFFNLDSNRFAERIYQCLTMKFKLSDGLENQFGRMLYFAMECSGERKLYYFDEFNENNKSLLEQDISDVTKYKVKGTAYHFIVFKTKSYYGSLEREGWRITIQLFKCWSDVRDFRSDGTKRGEDITTLSLGRGSVTINDLILYIVFNELGDKRYYFHPKNQNFTKRIFENMAESILMDKNDIYLNNV